MRYFTCTIAIGFILPIVGGLFPAEAITRIHRIDDLEQMELHDLPNLQESQEQEPQDLDLQDPEPQLEQNSTTPTIAPIELDLPSQTRQDGEADQPTDLSVEQQVRAWNQALYDRAKSELSEEFYTLYRLVDRLARANGLDQTSWQINLVDEAMPLAARANRIMISRRVYDQLYGDIHGLACVVGREMAHSVHRHTVITAAERDRLLAQFQAEAETEIAQELGIAEEPTRRNSLGGTVLRGVGQLFGGIGTVVTGVASSLIENERAEQAAEQAAERQQRVAALYQAKVAEAKQQWAELANQQTLEADRTGFEYLISAGFDPQGCIRAIQQMSSMGVAANAIENPMIDQTTSPPMTDRLNALQALPSSEDLARQGQLNLRESDQALTYESFGANQLRIHSRLGQQSIDQILGE